MSRYIVEKDFIYRDFRCVVIGTDMGHMCGYVGIPKGHYLHGAEYNDILIDVHGGLTYSGGNDGYPVESDLWWLGFDCAHSGDSKDSELLNQLASKESIEFYKNNWLVSHYATTKSLEYVENQLKNVVDQLYSVENLLREDD